MSALYVSGDQSWLEPGAGHGAFLRALRAVGVGRDQVVAIDLEKVSQPSDVLAGTLRGTEFLAWAQSSQHRFDCVVGNPPYVAISRLEGSLALRASRLTFHDGVAVGRRSNLWVAFLVASMRLLRTGGCVGVVLPASYEYADYAKPVREHVLQSFSRVETHRAHRPLFPLVQDGSIVLIARGYAEGPGTELRLVYEGLDDLVLGLARGDVASHEGGGSQPEPALGARQLGDVLKLRIGAVTGDAGYFLLSEERRRGLDLPESVLVPVLSRARHLRAPSIERADWRRLLDAGERVWLFRPSAAASEHATIARYLNRDADTGGCVRGFKTASRDPWYVTPLPEPPDVFLSGMSKHGPFLVFNNFKGLSATNTLYVGTFMDHLADGERYALAIYLIGSRARDALRRKGRRYPDGLVKFEPSDLRRLDVEIVSGRSDAKAHYGACLEALLQRGTAEAEAMADEWLQGCKCTAPTPPDRVGT